MTITTTDVLDAFGKLDAGLPVSYAEAFDADADPAAVLERLIPLAFAAVGDSAAGLHVEVVEDGAVLRSCGRARLWDPRSCCGDLLADLTAAMRDAVTA
jgi:hypothetical protein